MTCGDAVETLEKRVMYESLGEILEARTRLAKVIGRSQADIVYKKTVQKNEVLLKEQASEFERKMDDLFSLGNGQFDEGRFRRSLKNFKTEDARDEYLRIKSHEWVQEQSVIFVKNVVEDMQVRDTPPSQLPGCNVSRANKYMV